MQMAVLRGNSVVKQRSFTTFRGQTRPTNMIEVYQPLNVAITVNCRHLGQEKISIDDNDVTVNYFFPAGKYGYAKCIDNGIGEYSSLLVLFEYDYDMRESYYNLYIPIKMTDKNIVAIYPPEKKVSLIDHRTMAMKPYTGSMVIFSDEYIIIDGRVYICNGTKLTKVYAVELLQDTDRFIVNNDSTVTMLGDKEYKFRIERDELVLT